MLFQSDNLDSSIGCAPSLFCIRGSTGSMDAFTSVPGTYSASRRTSVMMKRRSNEHDCVQSKTWKRERAHGKSGEYENERTEVSEDVPPGGSQCLTSLEPYEFSLTNKRVVPMSTDVHNSHVKRLDTIELHRARKLKSSKLQEKRRSVMESHFGSKASLQTKAAFVHNIDGCLQVARPVVFRSSSTACISPVRKTFDEHKPVSTFQHNCFPSTLTEFSGHLYQNLLEFANGDSKSSSGYSSAVSLQSPANSSTELQNPFGLLCTPNSAEIKESFRPRSKSFTTRELLNSSSLSKTGNHRISSDDISIVVNNNDGLHPAMAAMYNNISSSDALGYKSNGLPGIMNLECLSSNTNNNNILVEAGQHELDHSELVKKKLKAARKKLKSTSKLSKSLHSLFPLGIGCTGSLTLQSNSSGAEGNPMYQCLTQFQTQSPKSKNSLNDNLNISSAVKEKLVTKSFSKRKKASAPCFSDPQTPQEGTSAVFTNVFGDGAVKRRLSNFSKLKCKPQKSLCEISAPISCVATKDLWYNKLAQVIAEEKETLPPTSNIQVSYFDPNTGTDICKTVNISTNTNARECISLTLNHLEMRDEDATKFQLWVRTDLDSSPYPLIGHEFPLSIKYNCQRELAPDNIVDMNGIYNSATDGKCQFILRRNGVNTSPDIGAPGKKVSKKARKSPIRNKLFRRSASKGDVVDGVVNSPPGILFGHPLEKLYEANGSTLPKPVMEMLTQLFQKGPFTVGIFRKSANARLVRELRDKLDSGCPTDLSATNLTAVAALFKDFLRSLPDALLSCQMYDEWLEIPRIPTTRDRISRTLLLCSRLPKASLVLLQHFLCVLHHIARRSSQNMMSPSNLAVCVGPSLLWPSSPVLALSPEASKQAPSVMEFLIESFGDIFGPGMLRLMGNPPEHDPARQDSGAEESDSLHSGHSLHSCNGRRDDSSIDSLERDLEGELSPLPRKDKMSLTNLSRDSGLTMSDTQLYTPDEEESESSSSGHSSGDKNGQSYSDHRPLERVTHYPAPNNPNAIYTAVCRKPDKISPPYDEPESYYATPSKEHTRVHITYSTPSYSCNGYSPDMSKGAQTMGYDTDGIYSVPNLQQSSLKIDLDNVNSNFQRDDWMRRKSNFRKASKMTNNESVMLRSNSEESLLNKSNSHDFGHSISANAMPLRFPSQDRSRSPPTIEYDDNITYLNRDSAIRRSRSAHYLAEIRREPLKDHSDISSSQARSAPEDPTSFLRSRSTPHIQDEGDRSYDSSTLSDDDSTPHVSRSNSRGKECGSSGVPSWDATLTPSDSGNSRNSSFKSERTGSVCTVVSAGSCSTLGSNPPSYEEALNRKSMIQHNPTGTPSQFSDYAIREEKLKSARAKQLYADSLKQYQENMFSTGDIVRASPARTHDGDDPESPPPLPPKRDPPPLPPKQKSSRRSPGESSTRIRHHPPVQIEMLIKKPKVSSNGMSSPQSSPYSHTMHKTIIFTDVNPPNLPPKESTVIEVVQSTNEPDLLRPQTERTIPSNSVEKKSIETQTDDYLLGDSDEYRDGDSQTSDSWLSDHITSVNVPDSSFVYGNTANINDQKTKTPSTVNSSQKRSRGRSRRRDSSASQRSRSVPSRDSIGDSDSDEWDYCNNTNAINYGMQSFNALDPELRYEISWSVSQLRERFGESQQKSSKVLPPPYRAPPSRAPITTYHLGAGDMFCRKPNGTRQHSASYGEESYV